MKNKILITRPEYDAYILANELKEMGYNSIIESMLNINNLKIDLPDLSIFDGLIFTSSNGVRAYSEISNFYDKPVLTVGDKTAHEARKIGFKNVHSAGNNVAELLFFLKSQKGVYAHFRGKHVKDSLSLLLEDIGNINIEEFEVYNAIKSNDISYNTLKLLNNNEISHVVFYSRRTAESFVELIVAKNCMHYFECINALCLADSMVRCLSVLPWKDIKISKHPNQQSMLELLK